MHNYVLFVDIAFSLICFFCGAMWMRSRREVAENIRREGYEKEISTCAEELRQERNAHLNTTIWFLDKLRELRLAKQAGDTGSEKILNFPTTTCDSLLFTESDLDMLRNGEARGIVKKRIH